MTCNHPDPELCERLGRHITGRLWEIWSGEFTRAPLPEATREKIIQGWVAEAGIARPPRAEKKELPKPLDRAWSFSKAIARHTLNGFRKRRKHEIEQLLEICENCPDGRFTGDHCAECGCCVGAAEKNFFNKLAWASEHCPLNHW